MVTAAARAVLAWAATFALLFNAAAWGGLIAYYPLDGDATDAGPNGLDGIVVNATPAEDRFGNPNGAMEFNGVNAYIELPASSLFAPHTVPGGVIRISAWVKVLALNTDAHSQPRQPVVSLGAPGNWSYGMYVYDDVNWAPGLERQSWGSSIWQKSGTRHTEITGPAYSVQLGKWTFVEIEYKYKKFNRVWVDGVLVAEQTSGFLAEPGSPDPLIGPWIGGRRDGQYLKAVIDDVRFYNHPTPEPLTMALWGIGAAALAVRRRRAISRDG